MIATSRKVIPSVVPASEPHDLRLGVVTVTPEMAAGWLHRRPDWQRPLKESKRDQIARDMATGEFMLNGETIVFSKGGWLLNGQTRLNACVAAGVPFQTVVVEGIADEAFATYDQMGVRTLATILKMRQEKHYNTVGAVVRKVWQAERNALFGRPAPTIAEGLQVLDANPGIRTSADAARRVSNLLIPSVAGYLHFEFSKRDDALADTFIASVASGAGLSDRDPFYHLRARLLANNAGPSKLPEESVARLTVKAWNYKREGREISCLKLLDTDGLEIM